MRRLCMVVPFSHSHQISNQLNTCERLWSNHFHHHYKNVEKKTAVEFQRVGESVTRNTKSILWGLNWNKTLPRGIMKIFTFYLAPTYILNTTGSLEMLCFSEVISWEWYTDQLRPEYSLPTWSVPHFWHRCCNGGWEQQLLQQRHAVALSESHSLLEHRLSL